MRFWKSMLRHSRRERLKTPSLISFLRQGHLLLREMSINIPKKSFKWTYFWLERLGYLGRRHGRSGSVAYRGRPGSDGRSRRVAYHERESLFREKMRIKLKQCIKSISRERVYICMFDFDKTNIIDVLRIEPNKPPHSIKPFEHPTTLSLFPFTSSILDASSTFTLTVLDGKIYVIGGASPRYHHSQYSSQWLDDSIGRFSLFKPSPLFYVCDPLMPREHRNWKLLPPMLAPRYHPSVLSANGKIYVVGCNLTPLHELNPFAEVYDLASKRWETFIDTIPEPNTNFRSSTSMTNCALVDDSTKILIILSDQRLSFTYPIQGPNLDTTIEYSICDFIFDISPVVVVSDIAYVFHEALYFVQLKNGAFDDNLQKPKLVKGFEKILKKTGPVTCPSSFFRIGGMKFVAVWTNCIRGNIYYVKFRIVKRNNDDLFAVVYKCSSYSNNHQGFLCAGM